MGQRAGSPWDINTHWSPAKVASDLADSAASFSKTHKEPGGEVISC